MEAYKALMSFQHRTEALNQVAERLAWDQETMMPRGAAGQRAEEIAAIQGIHMSSDRPWAIDRLGKQRIVDSAYPWQKLYQSGALIINGTDAPVEPINPLPSFYASVSRKTLNKTPEGGYEPGEKMSRELALRTYTINGAFAAFEEDIKGSIEVGKLADLTILDKDIMTIKEDEILDTKVEMTIIGGKVVYSRN